MIHTRGQDHYECEWSVCRSIDMGVEGLCCGEVRVCRVWRVWLEVLNFGIERDITQKSRSCFKPFFLVQDKVMRLGEGQ